MNGEKFKELLLGKIDSFTRWQEVCEEARLPWRDYTAKYLDLMSSVRAFHYGSSQYVNDGRAVADEQTWWLVREHYRKELEVYPLDSAVLRHVVERCSLKHHAPHMAKDKDDPMMVAYTPTMEDGLRDKQIRLSFGKFLRKFLFLATDAHIQALEAAHRSEMDPTFLKTDTVEDILRVYQNMAGDSGCMRYPASNWELKTHPSAAYFYPGLSVAYTEYDGTIKSRAVVYDNPDDPKDKRYVRIYGDPALKRKLELAGYRCANLQGAKLRAIKAKDDNPRKFRDNQYIVPYLDGSGGAQEERSGCYGYIVEGEDCIRLIDNAQADRLTHVTGKGTPRFKTTTPIHNVPVVKAELLQFVDPLDGKTYNSLEVETNLLWHEGAVVLTAANIERGFTKAQDLHGSSWRSIYVPTEKVESLAFRYGAAWYMNSEAARKAHGFHKLVPALYPDQKWAAPNVGTLPYGSEYILSADAMLVFETDSEGQWLHKSEFEALKSNKKYIALAPHNGTRALSRVDNPNMVMTLGKRRCIKDYHDIVELHDGTWEYSENTGNIEIMGAIVRVSRKLWNGDYYSIRAETTVAKRIESTMAMLRRRGHAGATMFADAKLRAREYMVQGCGRGYFFYLHDNVLFRRDAYDGHTRATYGALGAAAVKINGMTDQEIVDTWDQDTLENARCWALHAAAMCAAIDTAEAAYVAAQGAEVLPSLATQARREEAAAAALDSALNVVAEHIGTTTGRSLNPAAAWPR